MKKILSLAVLGLSALIIHTAEAGPVPATPIPTLGVQKNPTVPPSFFDLDQDKDGIPVPQDNCPGAPNHDQKDDNHNGIGDDCPVTLTGNGMSFCVKLDGGKVRCWGAGGGGEMGSGSTADQTVPVTVFELNRFYEVDFSREMRVCGIVDTGTHQVVCWGTDVASYATPQPNWITHTHPTLVDGISGGAKDLAMGDRHICSVSYGGHLYCWGLNATGQSGQPSDYFVDAPTKVDGLDDVKAAAAGQDHTCAIANDDHVYCWGDTNENQLGDPQANAGHKPRQVPNLGKAKALWAGTYWTCAELEDDTVKCWGMFPEEESPLDHPTPSEVPWLKGAKKIIETNMDFCGLLNNGKVECFMGPALNDVTDIAGGALEACALKKDGSTYCWGVGYLGDGTFGSSSDPVKVKFSPL